jgi:hypothetical protein
MSRDTHRCHLRGHSGVATSVLYRWCMLGIVPDFWALATAILLPAVAMVTLNGFKMVFLNILVFIELVQIISSTYGFSGEMLPYSDPNTCADNEYFDSRLLKCIPCNDLKNLEPTKDSGLLNKIIILTNYYSRNAHIQWTYLFQSCHALVTCRVRLCTWMAASSQSVNCVQTIKCQQQTNLTAFHVQQRLSTEMTLWFVQHVGFRRYMV